VAVTYDRDKAVAYALRFWDKPCNDQFMVVRDVRPNPKFQSLPFVPAAKLTRIDPGTSNLLNRDGSLLIEAKYIHDAAHFVCCCIGSPPGEHAGGLDFSPWDRSGKKPYGELLIADLVRRLEADHKRFETLLDESKDRTPPGSMEKGDVVAYWDKTQQTYTDIALYVGDGQIMGHSPSRGPSSGLAADWDYPHERADMRWTVVHVRTVKGKAAAAGTKTLKTQPFKVFTLLEHYWADPRHDDEVWNIQQAVPLTPQKMNPGFWDGAGVKTDQDFRDKVRDAAQANFSQDPAIVLKALRWAVAKIGPGSSLSYAGNHLTDTRPEEKFKSTERRDLESWEAVSCGKLALLYAAYQLRFDVLVMAERNRRESVKKSGPKRWETEDELFAGVTAEWSQRQTLDKKAQRETVRQRDPRIELQGATVFRDGRTIPLVIQRGKQRLDAGPPKLKEIFKAEFDADDGWTIKFIGQPKENGKDAKNRRFWKDADLKTYERNLRDDEDRWDKPIEKDPDFELKFFHLLWMTIIASHDHGASLVIDKLGYPYVNSLLWQSGLFDAARGGGMWIARNYGGGDTTHDSPSDYKPNEFEFWDLSGRKAQGLLVPVQRKTPDGAVIAASLSAASGVAFMVLLEQNRLVNNPACLRMKALLDRVRANPRDYSPGYRDDSPFGDGILSKPYAPKFKHLYSKIGLGSKRPGPPGTKNTSDVALLVTVSGVTYAAACLDAWGDDPMNKISKAIFTAVGG
jgi:hypothetical protein